MNLLDVPRPDEASRLKQMLADNLPALVLGGHCLGKRALVRSVAESVDGLRARIAWIDLRHPPSRPAETYRYIARGLLLGAPYDLRARAGQIESHYEALDLIEASRFERHTVVLGFRASSFESNGLRGLNLLIEAWSNHQHSNPGSLPRLVLVADLLQQDWAQLSGADNRFAYAARKVEAVELSALSEAQVEQLLSSFGLSETREGPALTKLLDRLGGHPHLLNLALSPLAARETTTERLLASLEGPRGALSPYFVQMHEDFSREGLLDHARGVALGDKPDEPRVCAALRAWGVSMPGEARRFRLIDDIFRVLYGGGQ